MLFASIVYAQSSYVPIPTSYPASPLFNIIQSNPGKIASGDINGDGYSDIISQNFVLTSTGYSSIIRVYSGLDRSQLYTFPFTYGAFCNLAVLGDITNDGNREFAIGSRLSSGGGRLSVYDGATGSMIYFITGPELGFGCSVASIGDVNNNGSPDFVVGAISSLTSSVPARAYVYDGTSFLIYSLPPSITPQFGYAVSSVGDINLDGISDFIVGAPFSGANPSGAYVYSGVNGALLYQYPNAALPFVGTAFGRSVAGGADFNGDNIPDFAIGNPLLNGIPASATVSTIYLFSGATGSLISSVTATGNLANFIFGDFITIGDFNGNGYSDIAFTGSTVPLSSSPFTSYRLAVVEGYSNNLLYQWTGSQGTAPYSIASGDTDSDGIDEILTSASLGYSNGIFAYKLGGIYSYSQTHSFNLAWSSSSPAFSSGTATVSGLNPGETVYIGISQSPIYLTLQSGDTLLINPSTLTTPLFSLQADANGVVTVPGLSLIDSGQASTKIYIQAFVQRGSNQQNVLTSPALEVTYTSA